MTPSDDPRAHRRALALLAVCGVLWSTAGVLIVLVAWPPGAIWSARSAIAAALLYAIRRPSLRGIAPAEWIAAAALAATTGLFILANKLTTPANAILIQYSAPVWVAVFAPWVLGERVTRIDAVAIALALAGIALCFLDQLTFDHAVGNAVALGAGVTFASGALAMRRVVLIETPAGQIDPLRTLVLGNLLGAAIGAPFWLAVSPLDAMGWGALLALGVLQQAAAYFCYAAAIRHARALDVVLVPVIEPILSPLWVGLAFGLWPSHWALLGGAIVVGAVTARGLIGPRG
jgi:drug/metabolite transporter (DMT)-like permease